MNTVKTLEVVDWRVLPIGTLAIVVSADEEEFVGKVILACGQYLVAIDVGWVVDGRFSARVEPLEEGSRVTLKVEKNWRDSSNPIAIEKEE